MPLTEELLVTKFLNEVAPDKIREAISGSKKNQIIEFTYPYTKRLLREEYEKEMHSLQIELAKFQAWIQSSGKRVAIIFEGRDAAGKGGTIKAVCENLNPRTARVVALSKPTEKERGEWYFQRYIKHLPTSGHITIFDRSWYNRAVVEKVFGFCTDRERDRFFAQVPRFEKFLEEEDIKLIKVWLNVGRAEQLRRFLQRETDPLKHWKLSPIDVQGLNFWEEYSAAIKENFEKSHFKNSPWTIVRSDDKRRARLEAIKYILNQFEYDFKDEKVFKNLDKKICGGPEIWQG